MRCYRTFVDPWQCPPMLLLWCAWRELKLQSGKTRTCHRKEARNSAFVTSLQAGGSFCIRGMGRVLFFLFLVKEAFPIRSTVSSCLKTYKSIKPLFSTSSLKSINMKSTFFAAVAFAALSMAAPITKRVCCIHPSLLHPQKKNNKKTNQQNSNATSTPTESKNASLLHLNALPMQTAPSPASPKAPLPPKQKKKKKKQQPKTQPFLLLIPFLLLLLLLQQKDNATSTNPVNRLA